jgi:hypothetical protein
VAYAHQPWTGLPQRPTAHIADVLTAHQVNATSGVLIHAHGGGIA